MMRLRVILRASFFFAFSFAWAGAINVLPQMWMLAHFPERRSFLLSALLLVGTCCAVGGMALSHWQIERGHALTRPQVIVATLGWLGGLFGMLWLDGLGPYAVAYCLFRWVSNWLYNHLDQTLVRVAGPEALRLHVTAAMAFQLAGMMLAPAFFTLFAHWPLTQTTCMLLLGLGTVAPTLALPLLPGPVCAAAQSLTRARLPLEGRFRAYTLLNHLGVLAFMTQLIYLLRDVYRMPHPETVTGLLLGLLAVMAAVAGLGMGRVLSPHTERWAAIFGSISLTFALALILFAWRPFTGVVWLVVPCVFAGLAYGALLASTRLFATLRAAGHPEALSAFNNMPNLAALGAYLLTAVLALLADHAPEGFAHLLLALVILAFLSAAALWAMPKRIAVPFIGGASS